MTYFRNHHLAIAAVLFAMAIAMYAVGLRLGAAVVLVLGAAVELAAWIALFTRRPSQQSSGSER